MPCKKVTGGWSATSQRGGRGVKSCVAYLLLPFLMETSWRYDFWWTASARADDANGLNRVSLSGLDVEKKRGEDVPPVTRSVAQMAHGWRKF